jgi:tol-pal system beta propeller repeat protein TolB
MYRRVNNKKLTSFDTFLRTKTLRTSGQDNQMNAILSILLLCLSTSIILTDNKIKLTVSHAKTAKMPLVIMIRGKNNAKLNEIAEVIKKDLTFTDQFEPTIEHCDADISKKDLRTYIKQLARSGMPLAICISMHTKQSIDCHLYDTIDCKAIHAKRYVDHDTNISHWAHRIADGVRTKLTGRERIFSSTIAYCKDTKDTHGKTVRKIYTADYDGSNEKLVRAPADLTIGLRLHPHNPELFYSEYTSTSVQLKSESLVHKKNAASRTKLSPFDDGISMLISFAQNGMDYAFCASRGSGKCQIYINKDGVLKRCTKNNGNNDCPGFIDSEHVCFCSNFQTGQPQIYIGNLATGHLQRITHGGYCTSPRYCAHTNQIAYHKKIDGTMQIMLYDCPTKTHTQVTHDAGNKHEVCLSPDGSYLLYSHETRKNNSRLAMHNLMTHSTKYVTHSADSCLYPDWA